jgi:hypothetical protein
MNFLHTDLGQRKRGDVVEVTLSGNAANVRLFDTPNFQRYRRGEDHRLYGGLAKRSPVRLQVPRSGHWHLVVDMQGLRGQTRAGVRVIPNAALQPLPPIRERRQQLADIAENIADVAPDDDRDFDVFISHATEDKEAIVRPPRWHWSFKNAGLRFGTTSSSSASGIAYAARSTVGSRGAASALSSSRTRSSRRVGRSTSSTGW